MKTKQILPCVLALACLTSCSKKEAEPVANVGTSSSSNNASSYNFNFNTTTTNTSTTEIDEMSSATVLDESGYGDSSYEVFYQHASRDELLLEQYPSADYLVYEALAEPFVLDSGIPLEIIHQTVREALGGRYESIRNSFDFITRENYLAEIYSSEDPYAVQSYYSLGLEDLSPYWFEGLSTQELELITPYLLRFYNINDLLAVNHYSSVFGMEHVLDYGQKLSAIETYLSSQPESVKTTSRELLNKVLYESNSISQSQHTEMLTDTMTVRELLSTVEAINEAVSSELLLGDWALSPKRIGYFGSDKHYGLSTIESIQATVSGKQYANVTETQSGTNVTSKTARLYIPKIEAEDYFVITLQEIIFDEDHIFTYIDVESASISTFNTLMAQDLHNTNILKIRDSYGLEIINTETSPEQTTDQSTEETPEDTTEESTESSEEELDVDGMSSATPEYVTVSTPNGSGGYVDVTVPHFPEKVVILDYAFFDYAAAIGIDSRFECLMIKDGVPSHLQGNLQGDINLSNTINVGDVTEIQNFQPDVIFANSQYAYLYDSLSQIAPVIMTDLNPYAPYDSFVENVARIDSIFSLQTNSAEFTNTYAQRVQSLKEKASGKKAVILSISDGALTVENTHGSMLFNELGMQNPAETAQTLSVEDLNQLAPDYIFVLYNDGSVALDVPTTALNAETWTIMPSGLRAMGEMISNLEAGIS